jgi:predicted nucleic acid-binding protein
VPQSLALFDRSLDLYARRPDKSYSMVDCISMVVCRDLEIADVLTDDRDFEQEGFVALLR